MTRARRIAAVALACAGALAGGLLPAAAPAQTGSPSAPPTITPRLLTVGLNLPSQGFQVGAVDRGQIVYARGLEVDLAREVARRMGLAGVRFVQQDGLDDLLAPGTKRWDVAFAQTTITAGRRRSVSFSVPYLASGQGVLLRRGLPAPAPTTLADLASLRLCVERGTTGQAIVRRRISGSARPTVHAGLTELMQALQAGRCDAAVMDTTILEAQRIATPERYGALMGSITTGERYGAVLAKGSALVPAVNRALNGLRRDGTIERIRTRWLGAGSGELPVIR